jgi:DNA polymerase III epsilon subunit-like protein
MLRKEASSFERREMNESGIISRKISEVPIAVIDLETTGLSPYKERIVEVSVVRMDPGCAPRLVFDTLVNPCCPVKCTYIHGISDEDVVNAPKFADITGELIR